MLVLSALVALVLVAATSGQNCQNGTEWNTCATNCMRFCWDKDPWCEPQDDECIGKCECPSYKPFWFNNTCVTEWDCIVAGYPPTTVEPESTAEYQPWTTTSPPSSCSHCMYGACAWDGSCEYGCADGFSGWDCSMNCSRCMGGACSGGSCDYGCAEGLYGWDCSMNCSWNCLDRACDQDNGYCTHGCVSGTDGAFCEDYCNKGCYNDWGDCETYDDYIVESCPWERQCNDCKCQGEECVDDRPRPSSAPVLISSTLLLLFTVCSINMLA